VDTKPAHFAESPDQRPEAARRIAARGVAARGVNDALEYARQMRLSLREEARSGRLRTFVHWKRLFDAELAKAREEERMRMALSQDWSGLGNYVADGLIITRHSIALDIAGLLSHLRFPGAFRLFEISVAVIFETLLDADPSALAAKS
jgi:hypothetical protein